MSDATRCWACKFLNPAFLMSIFDPLVFMSLTDVVTKLSFQFHAIFISGAISSPFADHVHAATDDRHKKHSRASSIQIHGQRAGVGLVSSMLVLVHLLGLLSAGLALALQPQIPSITGTYTPGDPHAPFTFTPHTRIIVTSRSLLPYARLFLADLQELSGWTLAPVSLLSSSAAPPPPSGSVLLQLDAAQRRNFTYRSGVRTGEGYAFAVSAKAYVISANEPVGVWWGTRTLLQQFVLARRAAKDGGVNAVAVASGEGSDVPGWEVRGAMLDVGRHFFTTGFLTELCAYASFYKLNTLHLHASDNLWDPRFLYSSIPLEYRKLYTGFRFRPSSNPSSSNPISGLVPPSAQNETWSHSSFLAMQSSCAARGVTLVPEIDTPGHSLVFTKWKPQLAMAGAPDNLNLSHPETIPAIQSVWTEFLPWFASEEVHIGADEYDRAFAGVYTAFINSMASFISRQTGGRKKVRVWGTRMPAANDSESISTDVTIQHWNFPDTLPVQLLAQGYRIINSEQAFLYTDGKTSYHNTQFPQTLNADLIWRTKWQPNIFTTSDPTNNTTPDHPGLRGALMALWNDWGNNATTPLEIFRQLEQSLGILAERTWAGADSDSLSRAQFDAIFPLLSAAAPAQNLARRRSLSSSSQPVLEIHGAAKEGRTHAGTASLGPPYTLRFTVRPYTTSGALFSGPDTKLYLDGLALAFEDVQTGVTYALTQDISDPLSPRVELPLNEETRVTVRATENGTWATLTEEGEREGEEQVYYWETLLDIWGEYMQRANMSFAAPAQYVGGEGFAGVISDVRLDAALT